LSINRRSLFRAVGSIIGATLPISAARGSEGCQPSQVGLLCSSYIPIQRLSKIYAYQSMSEWCWAASISMIFAYNNHPVAQARIVYDVYEESRICPEIFPPCLDPSTDNGRTMTETTSASRSIIWFSPELGVLTLTNGDLARQLENENPVIYCTAQHAMVLTSMSYVGSQVVEAWVMDTSPGNGGLRRLTPAEMITFPLGGQLRMAATLDIS
jgi:hypothetical protein